MKIVTTLNPTLCPKTIQIISEKMDSEGSNQAVYKGLRYYMDKKGMHVIASNHDANTYENRWEDADFNN